MAMTDKPRLVFFRYKVSQHLPEFLLIHRREHLKCLSAFFNVTVIDEDCNYGEICDKHCPDLALFETGLNLANSRRLSIAKTNTHPSVQKLAFVNADAWCETRSGTLSEMDQWGIETLFSISTTIAEHLPEMADRLFTWPPFIDTDVYRDYGEPKLIPIVLTGSQDPQYPWRRVVYRQLSDNYPSLLCPHGGYLKRSRELQVMYGEHYARTLNASLLVPACGTVAREAVRKHFEIPGCKACLIAEESAALKAAGFVDMQNCVFADASDVLDKVEYLFNNPAALREITDAGYELVGSQHTLGQRGQILQWYKLNKEAGPNQKIIQSNPFGALTLSNESFDRRPLAESLNGLHLALIRDGDEAIAGGNVDRARQLYQRSLNYMPRLPEASVKLGLCSLYQGDAEKAMAWILDPIEYSLTEYKADAPDPIEWAYYIVSLLCQGKREAARRRAAEFSWLWHPELDRVRWVVEVLANTRIRTPLDRFQARYRPSIHRLQERSMESWIHELCKMLEACGQNQFVKSMKRRIAVEALRGYDENCSLRVNKRPTTESARKAYQPRLTQNRTNHWIARGIRVRVMGRKARQKILNYVLPALHAVERRVGAFLPYPISQRRNGDLCKAVETVLRRERIRTVLIVGAAPKSRVTEAVLQGDVVAQDGTIVCVGKTIDTVTCVTRSRSRTRLVSRRSTLRPPKRQSEDIGALFGAILADNGINQFEAVLVDGSNVAEKKLISDLPKEIMNSAVIVLLTDINSSETCRLYRALLDNQEYSVVDYDLESSSGYAVFKRKHNMGANEGRMKVCFPLENISHIARR